MKNIALYGLVVVILLFETSLQAQSVRRSVISSIGTSGKVGELYISATVAQPPNAGNITGQALILRQGFQQPPAGASVPAECINAPRALFTVEKIDKECGEEYNFAYADVPEQNTSFVWTFGQEAYIPTSIKQTPTGISYSSSGTKIVTLEVKTGTCIYSASIALRVTKASFGAFVEGSSVACYADANGTIKLTTLNGTLPYTYKWDKSVSTSNQAANLKPGTYKITVTDSKGCSYLANGIVNGPDSIGVVANIASESCNTARNGAISLTVSGGKSPYTYRWSNGSTAKDINNLAGGTYRVTVTDAINCTRQLEFQIITVCEGFVFKNLITPNGDGANDNWVVPGILDYPDNELAIFNRWGARVYNKKNYDNTWQGTNNSNQPLPAGAYYYVLKLNDSIHTVYSGDVAILR